MTLEDIKSPLPPRRISVSEPIEETVPPTSEVPDTPPIEVPKKVLPMKFIVMGAIGIGIILILVLIFKLIIPKLGGGTEKQVTLNYWGLWEDSSVMQGVISDFETKNPAIKINYRKNQKNDYRTRLIGRLAKSNTGEEVPDVFRIHASWLPMFKGNLTPVPASTVKSLELDTDFFDVYKNDLKENGSYMAVPLMYDGLSLFYNKDLIESAQINLPKSWWDLENAAVKLTVKDENNKITVAGAAMGLTDNVDHWSDIVGLMMKQNGVEPLNGDVNNNKKMQDVLTYYTLFKTKDQVWNESLPSSTQLFANGKLAFYFAPSWRVFNIEEINPNLKFGITTVPQLPTLDKVSSDNTNPNAELTNIHWSTYWVEGVNNKSKYQKEAWKFLEYLASPEALEKMYATASQIRDFGEIYPRKSMTDKASSNVKVKPFAEAANNASNWYLSSNTYDDGLNDEMSRYFGNAISSIALKGAEPEAVITDLRAGINQLTQKYQLK